MSINVCITRKEYVGLWTDYLLDLVELGVVVAGALVALVDGARTFFVVEITSDVRVDGASFLVVHFTSFVGDAGDFLEDAALLNNVGILVVRSGRGAGIGKEGAILLLSEANPVVFIPAASEGHSLAIGFRLLSARVLDAHALKILAIGIDSALAMAAAASIDFLAVEDVEHARFPNVLSDVDVGVFCLPANTFLDQDLDFVVTFSTFLDPTSTTGLFVRDFAVALCVA